MKISVLLVAVASVLAFSAHVHADDQDYNDGLRQELNNEDVEQMYPKRPKPGTQVVAVTTPTAVQVQTVSTPQVQAAQVQQQAPTQVVQAQALQAQPATVQGQPVYILQQPQAAPPAQVQPVTNVEDAAVKEPKIESLRKQREDVERQTEDKLMQKLEDDRLESEKTRSDRIFAAPAPSPSLAAPLVVAPVSAVQQQAVVTPSTVAPVVPVIVDQTPVTNVRVEPDMVSATKVDTAPVSDEESTKFSVEGLAGIGSYPTVNNISGSFAGGVGINVGLPSRLGLELDGVFSNYSIQNTTPCFGCGPGQSLVENLNQINVTGGANYALLSGRVTPVVGVLAGYTRRSYSSTISYGYSSNSSTGSNAFDAGLNAGVDVAATDKLTISLDFKYMMNVSYRMDNALTYFGPVFGAPVEGLNYYFATLGLKLAL